MAGNDKSKGKDIVTNEDRNISALKSGLKLIPGVGDSISQFVFGRQEEAESRRLRDSVQEIADMVREQGRQGEVKDTEEWANLFTEAGPSVGKATNEDKRQRFRDLLFNSLFIPPGDPMWEESMYCLDQLKEIDPVGLYILAAVALARRDEVEIGLSKFSRPARWLRVPKTMSGNIPNIASHPEMLQPLAYNEVLVENAIDVLLVKKQLISTRDAMVTSGHSSTGISFYNLTPAGELLEKWTMAAF